MQRLPQADEYRRAVLNPRICFSDPELQNGKTSTNRQGLASVWTGQLASVFRIQTSIGVWAVKCFTSNISDHQDRYARIHMHIDNIGSKLLPMLAGFEYQPNGIRVNGAWYPIVKMEWVNGEKLDEHVEKLVRSSDTAKLDSLATQWFNLFVGLRQNQIAHGDLQHENILVSNGYLRLVDYDGMFVPSLQGRIGLEIGHIHYQHPRRTISDFNLEIDNFSALVIYLSIKALAADPGLWSKYHKDKHLILRNDDFKSPNTSPVIAALKASKNTEVRDLASALESACNTSLSSVPSLNSLVISTSSTSTAQNSTNWRSSWVGMEPVELPKTPPYTPPSHSPTTTYTPPQWQTATPSNPVPIPPSPKKSISWIFIIIGIGIIICLCLAAFGFLLMANISNQNAQATAIAQNMTATAWAIPFYSQTFDSAPEWEWLDDDGVGFVVENGKIRGNATELLTAWTLAGLFLGDVKIDVDIRRINGTNNNQIGVLCNATDTRHFYALVIGTDQTYSIWKQNGDEGEILAGWAHSPIINEGTTENHITAICNDGNLTLLVNGIELASAYDTSYSQGDVGIILGSFEDNAPVSVYFDNFNVSNP